MMTTRCALARDCLPSAATVLSIVHQRVGHRLVWQIAALLALGVSQHAARAALLACGKDVQRAAAHALEKQAAERRRREQKEREKAMAIYGKTPQGQFVDPEALGTLVSLGYDTARAPPPIQSGAHASWC